MPENLVELTSRVTTQGTTLCFPLGKTLARVLDRFGFGLDEQVVLRFSDERLEIRRLNTPSAIREKLKHSAADLRAFTERMRGYARDLPAGPDEEVEPEATREGELLGMLECLIADDLDPAVQKLESVDELGGPDRAKKRSRKKANGRP
jgi:hypothetical protein